MPRRRRGRTEPRRPRASSWWLGATSRGIFATSVTRSCERMASLSLLQGAVREDGELPLSSRRAERLGAHPSCSRRPTPRPTSLISASPARGRGTKPPPRAPERPGMWMSRRSASTPVCGPIPRGVAWLRARVSITRMARPVSPRSPIATTSSGVLPMATPAPASLRRRERAHRQSGRLRWATATRWAARSVRAVAVAGLELEEATTASLQPPIAIPASARQMVKTGRGERRSLRIRWFMPTPSAMHVPEGPWLRFRPLAVLKSGQRGRCRGQHHGEFGGQQRVRGRRLVGGSRRML